MKKEKYIKFDSAVNALAEYLMFHALTEGYEVSDNIEDWKLLAESILIDPEIKESLVDVNFSVNDIFATVWHCIAKAT